MLAETPPVGTQNAGAATLGSRFRATAAGEVVAVRWWHIAGCGGRDHTPTLWDFATGAVLASVPAAPPAALDGWVEAELAVPVPLAAGVDYVTSYTVSGMQGADPLPLSLAPDLELIAGGWAGGYAIPGHWGAQNNYADVVFIGPAEPDKSPRLLRSRAAILSALEAGGVAAATTGRFSAPCVLVEAGDPWAGPGSLGRRRVGRWRLYAIAGRADSDGVIELLAQLVDDVDVALLKLRGIQLPTWSRPINATVGGVAYAATESTIEYATEEDLAL
jgi:hypothetical protein